MLSIKKTIELNNELLHSVQSLDRIGTAYKKNLKDQINDINSCFVSSISKNQKLDSLTFNLSNYSSIFSQEKILEHIANYYFEILSNNATSKKESCEKFDSTLLYPNPNHEFYRHLDQIIFRNIQEIFSSFKITNLQILQEVSQGNPFLQNFSNHNPIVQNLILKAIKHNFDLDDEVILQARDKLLEIKPLARSDLQAQFSIGFQRHIQTPVVKKGPATLSRDRILTVSPNDLGIRNSSFRVLTSSTTQIQNPQIASRISLIIDQAVRLESSRKSQMKHDNTINPAIGRQINNQPQTLESRVSCRSILKPKIDFQSPSSSPKTYNTTPIAQSRRSSPYDLPSEIRAKTLHSPRRTLTPLIP